MNPVNQRFENRIYKRLAIVEKALQDIKTAQPIGIDSLQVLSGNLATASITIAAGDAKTFITTFTAGNGKLQMLNFAASFFIDHDGDLNYLFRRGASLDSDMKMSRRNDWEEWATSNDELGIREYCTLVDNRGSNPHTYYYYVRAYFEKGGAE
jgi:hypothetical protein